MLNRSQGGPRLSRPAFSCRRPVLDQGEKTMKASIVIVVLLLVVSAVLYLFGFFTESSEDDPLLPAAVGDNGRSLESDEILGIERLEDPLFEPIEPRTGHGGAEDAVLSDQSRTNLCRFLVRTEDGLPVPGAEAALFRRPMGDPLQKAISNDSGELVLDSPHPGDEILARAIGFVPTRISLGERPWPDPHPIVLHQGETVFEGKVINDICAPVEGAEVTMRWAGATAQAITSFDGTFCLTALDPPEPPFAAAFRIAHPSYCFLGHDVQVTIEEQHRSARFTLYRWAKLFVEVFDHEGQPLPGAKLSLAGPPAEPGRERLPGLSRVPVALDCGRDRGKEGGVENQEPPLGGYMIEKVPPLVPLWLVAKHPRYESVENELGKFEPAAEGRYSVHLAQPANVSSVAFRVLDSDRNPVSDAEAWLSFEDADRGAANSRLLKVDGNGCFRLTPPAETWDLAVTASGFAPFKQTFYTADLGTDTIELILETSDLGILAAVAGMDGKPLPGVLVRVEEEKGGSINKALRTDDAGEALFTGLVPESACRVFLGFGNPGSYFGKVKRDEVPSPAIYRGVRPGAGKLIFRLVPPASVSGRVSVEGVAQKVIFLSLMEERSPERGPVFTIDATMGSRGEFFFNGLPPGRYHLWIYEVSGGDHFNRPLTVIDLAEGERLRDLVVDGS